MTKGYCRALLLAVTPLFRRGDIRSPNLSTWRFAMPASRRRFLIISSAALGSVAVRGLATAAEGASARTHRSPQSIYKIARGLVLGIGREAWQYATSLGSDQVLDFVERLNPQLVEARVATLQHPIDIKL